MVYLEPVVGQETVEGRNPISQVQFGLSPASCAAVHNSTEGLSNVMAVDTECTEPVVGDDGRYHTSCLSPPATLTPGGVINNLFMIHYPYPKDQRVVVGQRTWEFVYEDPSVGDGDGEKRLIPAPSNQLYVHHMAATGKVHFLCLGLGVDESRTRIAPDVLTHSPAVFVLYPGGYSCPRSRT